MQNLKLKTILILGAILFIMMSFQMARYEKKPQFEVWQQQGGKLVRIR